MYRLTEQQIDALIHRYHAGEAPLDQLATEAIFGSLQAKPVRWGDWPAEARKLWDQIFSRELELTQWMSAKPQSGKRKDWQTPPTIEQAWRAIEGFAPDPDQWWLVPGLNWRALKPILGCPIRTISYQLLDIQGWRFTGLGRRRRVTAAPCVECEMPHPPSDLLRRTCLTCREGSEPLQIVPIPLS